MRKLFVSVGACAGLLLFGNAATAVSAGAEANVRAPATAVAWRDTIRTFASEHFKHPAWGYSHCERDYRLAVQLAGEDGARIDDDVLFAAAYLHDIAAFPPWEKTDRDHADQGADVVAEVLNGSGFPMEKLEAVRGAIRTHMYDRTPNGPESLYLHDADALDWLGAIGVARIVALVDPHGGRPTGSEVVGMLDKNLADVPARVLSKAGRAHVPERVKELEKFLRDLRRESAQLQLL